MNTNYNYLHGSEKALSMDYNIENRPDPDIDGCRKLYDDIVRAYFTDGKIQSDAVEVSEQQFKYIKQYSKVSNKKLWQRYFALNNDNPKEESAIYKPPFYTILYKKYLLTSDYIGPSIYWAIEKGLSSNQIICILNKSRTIGGHIVWPRGKGTTINQARSGEKAFYDRIDWTLFLIKQFCDNGFDTQRTYMDCTDKFGGKIGIHIQVVLKSINTYREWFEEFGDYGVAFMNFCKQFKLELCFVDEKFNINWLAPPVPLLPDDYEAFALNNILAIEKRNMLLK